MTTLSLVRPEAFQYGVLASDRLPGLLLYGPPGTGKTLLAKAVAKESGATVLSVSSAQLNDMYVGEGEKNVAALFSLAKKLTPCVIFLDEADAIFSARGNRGSRVNHRELLNQFLTEWDGMSNDASGAFIMVATNRPMDLDDAVLRRLPRRLLVDLPAERDRLAILNIHLRDEVLAEGVDLAELAKRTPFYSGSDLKNLAVAAALECVREENDAAKKHVGVEAYKHSEKRTLNVAHFEKALGEISASISEDMTSLRDIKKFDEQYGDKRGKKRKSARWGFNSAAEANKVLDTVKVRS
jgi:SpoVK/Ycf46/Vps4 family AAA+-type ATPase